MLLSSNVQNIKSKIKGNQHLLYDKINAYTMILKINGGMFTMDTFGKDTFVISVKLVPGNYRHIQMAAEDTFHDLHEAILTAFGFDDWMHLHQFTLRGGIQIDGATSDYYGLDDRESDKEAYLKDYLYSQPNFEYVFDFGDWWSFKCDVLRIEPADLHFYSGKVVRSKGGEVVQYPSWDEDWE